MNSHTLYLDILILLALLHPAGIGDTLYGAFAGRINYWKVGDRISYLFLLFSLVGYLIIVPLVGYLKPEYIRFASVQYYWILIAILVGIGLFLIELGLARCYAKIKTGKWQARVVLSSLWETQSQILKYATACLIPLGEELIFRQLLFYHLLKLNTNMLVIIFVSAVCYGLNHVRQGSVSVVFKSISGLGYALLFYISGFSFITVFLCHLIENIFILSVLPLFSKYQRQYVSKKSKEVKNAG